ncbi:MAG: type III pantothenate kinase [Cyanobium sp.]
MKASEPPRWLLIGNSRWHWAWPDPEAPGGLAVLHTGPAQPCPDPGALIAWAAVGPVPADRLACERRLEIEAVPLAEVPPWLGIDRALAGWLAWRGTGQSVLVADAGTVLSLTWVDGGGAFRGGRLLAGAALQLRAMAAGTAQLPKLEPAQAAALAPWECLHEAWPRDTVAAMRAGVLRGLAATIAAAHAELCGQHGDSRLVITGGDARALLALPGWPDRSGSPPEHHPDLALRALAALRPQEG